MANFTTGLTRGNKGVYSSLLIAVRPQGELVFLEKNNEQSDYIFPNPGHNFAKQSTREERVSNRHNP
jgi:hypothetical protein